MLGWFSVVDVLLAYGLCCKVHALRLTRALCAHSCTRKQRSCRLRMRVKEREGLGGGGGGGERERRYGFYVIINGVCH